MKLTPHEKKILALIEKNPEIITDTKKRTVIAKENGLSEKTLRNRIGDLKKYGVINLDNNSKSKVAQKSLSADVNNEENLETLSAQTLESLSTQQTSEESFPQTQEVVLENKEMENDKLLLKDEYEGETKVSNGLENFKLDEETPELFNLENETETAGEDQSFISFNEEKNSDEDEDELAIPAFLRRQKN